MKKNRILFLLGSLNFGGAEKQTIELVNRLDPARFETGLCYFERIESLLGEINGARPHRIYCLDKKGRFDFRLPGRLRQVIRDFHPDMVVCVNPYTALMARLIRGGGGSSFRWIVILHTTVMRDLYNQVISRLVYRRVLRRAEALVFVCRRQKEYWTREYGFKGEQCHVIHNGIDPARFDDRPEPERLSQLKAELGIPSGAVVIAACAALRPEKKHTDLIDAVRLLTGEGVPVAALIVGDGPERAGIERHIAARGLGDRIRLTGFQRDVRPFLRIADIVVMTSVAVETFSIAVLEAMALGKPVVAADIGGAAEQVIEGENGFLYPPGDVAALAGRLKTMIRDNRLAAMGKRSRQMVEERFTVGRMVDRYERLLSGLLAGTDGGAGQKMATICVLGPGIKAEGGVATHLRQIFNSSLRRRYRLLHFHIGSQGRREGRLRRIIRTVFSPAALFFFLRKEQPALLHVNSSMYLPALLRDCVYSLVGRLTGAKILYQIHGGDLPGDFCRRGPIHRRLLGWTLRRTHALAVLGRHIKDDYIRCFPDLTVFIVPNAIDLAPYSSTGPDPAENETVLFYIGRLSATKGIAESIEALALLKDDACLSGVRFYIAGDGEARPDLERRVRSLGLTGRVIFLGPVYGREKYRWWSRASVLLFPTYHTEGMPYAVIESLAAATPLITTAAGAIAEMIEPDIQGIFVEPRKPGQIADALHGLLVDNRKRLRMADACRQLARERFGIDRLAADLTRIYDLYVKP